MCVFICISKWNISLKAFLHTNAEAVAGLREAKVRAALLEAEVVRSRGRLPSVRGKNSKLGVEHGLESPGVDDGELFENRARHAALAEHDSISRPKSGDMGVHDSRVSKHADIYIYPLCRDAGAASSSSRRSASPSAAASRPPHRAG